MKQLLILIVFVFLLSCKSKLEEECVGTYVISKEDSSPLLNGRCIKLIVLENRTFVFINECNTIVGTWDIELNEFVPITFYDTKSKKEHNARFGKKSIFFLNPHLLLNDESISKMRLIKQE